MPSQPFDTGWDFGLVLDLIDSDAHDIGSPTLVPETAPGVYTQKTHNANKYLGNLGGVSLGSFGRLFQELGISDDEPPSLISSGEHESDGVISEDTLLPLPVFEQGDVKTTGDSKKPDAISGKFEELRTEESTAKQPVLDDPFAGLSKKQRHQARKRAEKEKKAERKAEKKREKLGQKEQQRKKVLGELQKLANASQQSTTTPHHSAEGLQKSLDHDATELSAAEAASRSQPAEPLPTPKQVRARSNVGAKIRPATPVELDSSFRTEEKSTRAPSVADALATPTPALRPVDPSLGQRQLSFHALPFSSGSTEHPPIQGQQSYGNAYMSTAVDLNSALAIQHNAFEIPVQYQHLTSASQLQSGHFQPQFTTPGFGGLVPRTVHPIVSQRPTPSAPIPRAGPVPFTPIRQSTFPIAPTIRPQVDRHHHFFNKLMHDFPEDKKYLVAPMQLCNEKTTNEGIHIFVDASNIMIGFKDLLREHEIGPYDMSFASLALLMERRRPVAKRVFAGSHREADPHPHVTKLVETSKAVGYENNVKEQVFIRREDTEKKKFFKDVKKMGWTKAAAQRRSGSGSDTEMGPAVPATPSAPKWVEQGVDEILHLKMCQSIIDTEVPTTMVLATGDGAEAEYSDGFLAHVERALRKGWRVELVSWKQQTSGGYKNRRFRTKWGENFKIIELDAYFEALIDTA